MPISDSEQHETAALFQPLQIRLLAGGVCRDSCRPEMNGRRSGSTREKLIGWIPSWLGVVPLCGDIIVLFSEVLEVVDG